MTEMKPGLTLFIPFGALEGAPRIRESLDSLIEQLTAFTEAQDSYTAEPTKKTRTLKKVDTAEEGDTEEEEEEPKLKKKSTRKKSTRKKATLREEPKEEPEEEEDEDEDEEEVTEDDVHDAIDDFLATYKNQTSGLNTAKKILRDEFEVDGVSDLDEGDYAAVVKLYKTRTAKRGK